MLSETENYHTINLQALTSCYTAQ